MRAFLVNTEDKGMTDISTVPVRSWVKELCENRTFKSHKQLQELLMVVDVSEEAYNRGLGCPADARRALDIIKSLPKFETHTAYVISRVDGKDLHDKVNALAKQGKVLSAVDFNEPSTEHNFWWATVVDKIEYIKEA